MKNRQGNHPPARHTLRLRVDSHSPAQSSGQVYSGAPYVTNTDLLRNARRNHCGGIHSEPVLSLCHPEKNFWVFNAAAYKSSKCRGFVGYGDAHLGNVSPLIFNRAEMRMVETRAINRALSKAYGEALCSLEGLLAWPLSPEHIPVLRHALQCRPPFQKGVLNAARSNPARSRQLVGALAGLERKILQKTQFCGVYQKYGTGTRRGRWQGRRLAESAGRARARARMGRAIGMCNRVAHMKNATMEETLTLIESPREDILPVQPVAQCLGIKTLTNPLAAACGGAQDVSTRAVMSGQGIPDLWQGRSR